MEKPALAKVRLASCGAEYFGRNEDSLYRASWRTIQRPVGNMALDVLRSSHGLNCISKAMLLPASDCTQLLFEVEGCWRLMHMMALERQTCDHTVIFCPAQQLIQVMATKELCSVRCLTWSTAHSQCQDVFHMRSSVRGSGRVWGFALFVH